jgi:hypothetical protein
LFALAYGVPEREKMPASNDLQLGSEVTGVASKSHQLREKVAL